MSFVHCHFFFVAPKIPILSNKHSIINSFCFVLFFVFIRLNSSLIGLVAIAANPTENATSLTVSNGVPRTTAPTIVKPIHNGNGSTTLVNMTNSETLNSEYSISFVLFQFFLSVLIFTIHTNSPLKYFSAKYNV